MPTACRDAGFGLAVELNEENPLQCKGLTYPRKTDKNVFCHCTLMIYGLICPKKPAFFHFNHLLSQKRLAKMVTGDYNTGLVFMAFDKVYRSVSFVFKQL